MATPLEYNPYTGWQDVIDDNNVPPGARPVKAADLLRYENFNAAARDRINEHDTKITGLPPAANTPFLVRYVGTAWEFANLEAATAAGLQASQTIWFLGGSAMPTWARTGDIWTQG